MSLHETYLVMLDIFTREQTHADGYLALRNSFLFDSMFSLRCN